MKNNLGLTHGCEISNLHDLPYHRARLQHGRGITARANNSFSEPLEDTDLLVGNVITT